VIKKEAEKILKYKELIIEILRAWNVKAELIPVIMGAIGTISKSLKQYLRIVIISKNTRHSTWKIILHVPWKVNNE
jgi:hypothetical protein